MPKRDDSLVGVPCWIDLFSSDTDRSCDFYAQLFGWTFVASGEEFGGYINFAKDGGKVAGCMKNDGASGLPDVWSVYLSTADAKAAAERSVALGGSTMVEPMAVGDLGTMAVMIDTGQAAIGAWQRGAHDGFDNVAEPGTPAWIELLTRDYDASVAYYRDVFGWDTYVMSDSDEFRYTTLGEGASAAAGIMDASGFLPEGVPAHWSVYFGVEDADAAVAKVAELGGTLIMGIDETPFGRLASFADSTGALFKIVQSPES